MNYQESREYIDRITREIPSVLGLDHMRELMKRLGNPQDDLKYVHVAGTNGKGSVIAFLYSALSGAGYRIGRYVSPTLYSYRGRMEVAGSRISRESFAAYITQVAEAIIAMTKDGYPHPTAFEIETAVAFLFFRDEKGGHHITLTDEGMEIKGNTTKLLYTLQSRRSLFKGKMIFGVMEIFLTVFMEMGVVLLLGKIHGYTEAFPAGQFFYASWRRVQKQEV